MELKEKINRSYELRNQLKNLEETKKKLEEELSVLDSELLESIKGSDKDELEFDGLFLNLFRRKSVAYDDEKAVLNYLKENGYSSLITIKTTESLNKNAIKKELKTNSLLNEALSSHTTEKVTEYITVTDAESHQKLFEHIEEGKTK
jgi:phage host-nuclease inhibitor protein Gam